MLWGPHGCYCPSFSWGSRHPSSFPALHSSTFLWPNPNRGQRPVAWLLRGRGEEMRRGDLGGCSQAPKPQAPGGGRSQQGC